MQMTVRSVSEMLQVSEASVVRLVKYRGLPAQRIAGHLRFSRVDVLDWAIANRFRVQGQPFDDRTSVSRSASFADALAEGGVHYRVPGDDGASALQAVVERLPLPPGFDREALLRLFVAREARGSTAIGDGIAIPHVRRPIVLRVHDTLATLCFLSRPISYQAPDGKPVRILFSIVSSTVAAHVQILAQLSRALHDPGFRKSVMATQAREMILQHARRVEEAGWNSDGSGPRAA
jgi:PTS system nitrogen regulatory IIA component